MRTTNRKPKHPTEPIDVHVSKKKYDELCSKLSRLKKQRTPAAKEVARLAELGDFSENVEYQLAKRKLRSINNSMLKLGVFTNAAIIIKPSKGNTVQLGSTVTVEIDGKEKTYTILGSSETNPSKGIISQHSPIGLALLGKKVGNEFQTSIGGTKKLIRIISC